MALRKTLICLFLLVLASCLPRARAGELPLAAEALTHQRGGKTDGCGMRITGGSADVKAVSVWIDVSVNVYASGAGVIQAIAYEIPPSRYETETRPVRVPIQHAWVKARDAAGSTRLGENAEARDALVYGVTLDDAARLFEAVAASKPLAIGIRAWGRPRESVFEGTAQLSDTARESIAACLAALVN